MRQAPWSSSTTVATVVATAAHVGSDRVVIYYERNPALWLDGVATDIGAGIALTDGSTVTHAGNVYQIHWASGQALNVTVLGNHLDVNVGLTDGDRGALVGLLGNFNKDPSDDIKTRAGVVMSQPLAPAQLYRTFADEWRISDAESLFDYGPGQSTATFTNHSFPSAPVTAQSLDPTTQASARATCTSAGITDPPLLDACTLDVGITGDASFTQGSAAAGGTPTVNAALSYIGCFVDSGTAESATGHDLSGFFVRDPAMTVELCATICNALNLPYTAVQSASGCFCGSSYGRDGAAPESDCSQACVGNMAEMCGGSDRNSVYHTPSLPPPAPPAGADILAKWASTATGCDGREVEFQWVGNALVGRITVVGQIYGLGDIFASTGSYACGVGDIEYIAVPAGPGIYNGWVRWKGISFPGLEQWRDDQITIAGDQYSDTASGPCANTRTRQP